MWDKKQIIFPLRRPKPRAYACSLHNLLAGFRGLTLLEIMIVIAIIGILASIATPTLLAYRKKAKNTLAIAEIRLLEKEIQLYQIKWGRLPDSLNEVKLGNIDDPWGNPYQYLKIAEDDDAEKEKGKGKDKEEESTDDEKGKPRKDHFMVPVNSDFDLYSMGEDGKSAAPFTAKASLDDIVRVSDGKYVGPVSDF